MGLEKLPSQQGSERKAEMETCPRCDGTGKAAGTKDPCGRCRGTGKLSSGR
jgi:DnaJ-class molecular chaperone